MSNRERAWQITVEGFPTITTSELTIDEAALCEEVSGIPWTLMNPHASVKVAKALLVVLLKRSRVNAGATVEAAEHEAIRVAGGMTIDTLHGAFTFLPGTAGPDRKDPEAAGPPSSAPTSVNG
jgi:hypothetical protein